MKLVKGPGITGEPGAVAIEPARRRVRAQVAGMFVGDSEGVYTLFEHGFSPRWYFPVGDVRADLLRVNGQTTDTLGRGPARWYDMHLDDRVIENAAWDHPSTPPDCPSLEGLIAFEWNLMDAWFEEDDEIPVHPRDPYSRVEILSSSRHVLVQLDGEVVADSRRPLLVLETGLPTRYYLPMADFETALLTPSDSFTWCPYKGRAEYWDVTVNGHVYHDIVWAYSDPFPFANRLAGHRCPFNEFFDITVDGKLVERPDSKWKYHGPNAYTFREGDEEWDPTAAATWSGDDAATHR